MRRDKWFDRYEPFFGTVARRVRDDAVVLEIGANDGRARDPVAQVWRPGWRGLMVEPNPVVFGSVRSDGRKLIWFNVAIGETDGSLRLYSMTEAAAAKYKRVRHDSGLCLTSFDREHIERRVRKFLPETWETEGHGCVRAIDVTCQTLETFLAENRIDAVDLVQIDTEGFDGKIARQVAASDRIRPAVVLWEHQHLGADDRVWTERAFRLKGYDVVQMKNDTMAWRPE